MADASTTTATESTLGEPHCHFSLRRCRPTTTTTASISGQAALISSPQESLQRPRGQQQQSSNVFQQQWRNLIQSASRTSSNAVADVQGAQEQQIEMMGRFPTDLPAFPQQQERDENNRQLNYAMSAENCCLRTWAIFLGIYHLLTGCVGVGQYSKGLVKFSNATSLLPTDKTLSVLEISDTIVRPTALKMSLFISTSFLGLWLIYATLKKSRDWHLLWLIWFSTMEVAGFLELLEFQPFNLFLFLWQSFKAICEMGLVGCLWKGEPPNDGGGRAIAAAEGGQEGGEAGQVPPSLDELSCRLAAIRATLMEASLVSEAAVTSSEEALLLAIENTARFDLNRITRATATATATVPEVTQQNS